MSENFSDLPLDKRIQKQLKNLGFKTPTQIQLMAIPPLVSGKDLIGISKTGTGKTLAFLLPSIQRILELKNDERGRKYPKLLVLVPTRELALQVANETEKICGPLQVRVCAVYGGEGYKSQEREIQKGLDVVVGTPGRVLDYFRQSKLRFNEIQTLVLDEADRLFDFGFKEEIFRLIRSMPRERQIALFSATMGLREKSIAFKFMNQPVEVSAQASEDDSLVVKKIDQSAYHVGKPEKMKHLMYLIGKHQWNRVLIFCNTKNETIELGNRMRKMGARTSGISSLLPQKQRVKLIEDFRSGKLNILAATDVASRGLDIEDVDAVINYDVPLDFENYVHRVGRTARAGAKGMAVTLVDPYDSESFSKLETSYLKMKIPILWLSQEELNSARQLFSDYVQSQKERAHEKREFRDSETKSHKLPWLLRIFRSLFPSKKRAPSSDREQTKKSFHGKSRYPQKGKKYGKNRGRQRNKPKSTLKRKGNVGRS